MNNNNGSSQLVKLGGVWRNQRKKDGRDYFAGRLGAAKILILPNPDKTEGDTNPDYVIFLTNPTENQP